MAAIDLERGLEHSGRGWGQERPELMDNFDSEMQEWEDQLQDIQRKIEELYNEVQARRGANDASGENQSSGVELGRPGNGHPAAVANGFNRPASRQNGYGVSEIGDLLQDYLGQGKGTSRKNNGARHVHFNDKVKVSHGVPAYQEETRPTSGSDRVGQEPFPGSAEESENRKKRASHAKSCPNKENAGVKPPVGQREAAVVQPRSQFAAAESPAPDRKSYVAGVVGEKKCSSPYVLRKFGAMLQENEGKMLTDSGVVTPQGPIPEIRCSTPGCQRRAAGAKALASRSPLRSPAQMGPAESEAPTARTAPSQEWASPSDSVRQNHRDQRGGYGCSKPSPQQARRRSQAAGSPKTTPRSNCEEDRDAARRAGHEHTEPKMDYRVSSASSGAQRLQRGGLASQGLPAGGQVTDEGLIELLDMLDIQHEYSSSPRAAPTAYRQVNPVELSPEKPRRSFCRPARPANQRPPSRWAGRAPAARTPGPARAMYRSPSPMSRNPSPSLKHRPLISYSLQTETVIM